MTTTTGHLTLISGMKEKRGQPRISSTQHDEFFHVTIHCHPADTNAVVAWIKRLSDACDGNLREVLPS